MKNTVSSLVMLTAGLIAVLYCIILQYTLETTLIIVVTVLFIFMIIGLIAQKIINCMTKEAEERFQREEARRREEEAAAAAAAAAEEAAQAALAEEAAKAENQQFLVSEQDIVDTGEGMYFAEPLE